MNVRALFSRILAWIALPVGVGVLAVGSTTAPLRPVLWSEDAFAWVLAPVLLVFSAILGLLFRQVRVSLMALVVGALVWKLRAIVPGTPSAMVLTYLSGPLLPLAAIVFLVIPEQRLLTEWGIARLCLAFFFAGMLAMLPELDGVQTWFVAHPIPSLAPMLHLSVPAALAWVLLLGIALGVRRHATPNIGLFFVAATLHALTLGRARTLATNVGLPADELEAAFAISAAFLLAWLSIDCGWRNAFMDELTQLPNRHAVRLARGSENEIHITVSIGVARTDDGDNPDDVLTAADQSLYKAKKAGRNRVCVAKTIAE